MTDPFSTIGIHAPSYSDFDRDEMMTPAEVARVMRVSTKTVINWANSGRIFCVRTPGQHRRFPATCVVAMFEGRLDEARFPARKDQDDEEQAAS